MMVERQSQGKKVKSKLPMARAASLLLLFLAALFLAKNCMQLRLSLTVEVVPCCGMSQLLSSFASCGSLAAFWCCLLLVLCLRSPSWGVPGFQAGCFFFPRADGFEPGHRTSIS